MVQNQSSSTSAPAAERALEGRRVLLTGGSRGIGAAIARWLMADGARVVATARTVPESSPEGLQFVAGDVRTEAGVQAIADAAVERLGGVDVIVNNAAAGRAFPAGSLAIDAGDWQDTLDVILLAAVRLNAALLPQMLERKRGAIVHIASSAAFDVPAPLLHYGAAKAALIAYSKGLATELAPHGIRVNTITPGHVETPGGDKVRDDLAASFGIDVAAIHATVPLGRIGLPDEIAEAVAYLVSDRAAYVIGANLVIDGGEQRRP
jgi:NAD(P)-dependent dehydrogenase (short-subunit alcohol dehydrogenase family)